MEGDRRTAVTHTARRLPLGLLLVLAPSLSSCSLLTGPDSSDTAGYRSYAQIERALRDLEEAHPDLVRVVPLGRTLEGRDILAVKISARVEEDRPKPGVLVVAGQHAREWLTVEVSLELARRLAAASSGGGIFPAVVDRGEVWVVPVANPDGLEHSRSGDRFWRKNRRRNVDGSRGVDVNRNFDYAWGGRGSSVSPAGASYRGSAAFSEPESRAIRDLVVSRDFLAAVDYHAYAQSIHVPSGDGLMRSTAERLATLMASVHGKVYRAGTYEPPLFGGSFTDWANQVAGVDAYLIELRPGSDLNPDEHPWLRERDPFAPPESEILPTVEEQLPALEYLLQTYLLAESIT